MAKKKQRIYLLGCRKKSLILSGDFYVSYQYKEDSWAEQRCDFLTHALKTNDTTCS